MEKLEKILGKDLTKDIADKCEELLKGAYEQSKYKRILPPGYIPPRTYIIIEPKDISTDIPTGIAIYILTKMCYLNPTDDGDNTFKITDKGKELFNERFIRKRIVGSPNNPFIGLFAGL